MHRFVVTWLCLCSVLQLSAQITYEEVWIDYDSAAEYKNLKVIPVRRKDQGGPGKPVLSLAKGLQSGQVMVSERGTASTENVHWLRVNNNSGEPVFIASGEIVTGGRQDRMITRDTVLESMNSDQYIPVMCVEENRWSEKERKFRYASFANPKLRKVLDHSKNQVLVWKEIYAQLDSSNIESPTLAYASRKLDKKFMTLSDEYLRYCTQKLMGKDTNIVGFVCMTGNKIIGSDIYNDIGLFSDHFTTLLTGYIEEAIIFGSPNKVGDTEVRNYLDRFMKDDETQAEYLKKNGKVFRRNGKAFHITSY